MEIAFPLKENKLTNEKKTKGQQKTPKNLCEIRGQMAGYKRYVIRLSEIIQNSWIIKPNFKKLR